METRGISHQRQSPGEPEVSGIPAVKGAICDGIQISSRVFHSCCRKGDWIMELIVRGKNLEITDALKSYVEKHTGKVQRYFDKSIKINALLRISNMTQICEVTVYVDGVIIRGVEKSDDMYKSIDLVFDKVERQIHKYKTRLAKRFKEKGVFTREFVSAKEPEGDKAGEFDVVRVKQFQVSPMSVEEAILQMNLLGHDFFLFFNSESDKTAVVYRRKDGKYGLIESEM